MMQIRRQRNKKGAYSILTVMLALIMVLSFTAYVDIMQKSFVMSEVQQRLDTSGLNALNDSIDTSRLRLEELAVDADNRVSKNGGLRTDFKNKIVRQYQEEVYKQIKTNDVIKDIQVRHVDVTLSNSTFGTGRDGEALPQLTLDSIVYLKVRNSQEFDLGGTTRQEFYDAQSGQNFAIEVVDTAEDGTVGMLIRSSTRVVYR